MKVEHIAIWVNDLEKNESVLRELFCCRKFREIHES